MDFRICLVRRHRGVPGASYGPQARAEGRHTPMMARPDGVERGVRYVPCRQRPRACRRARRRRPHARPGPDLCCARRSRAARLGPRNPRRWSWHRDTHRLRCQRCNVDRSSFPLISPNHCGCCASLCLVPRTWLLRDRASLGMIDTRRGLATNAVLDVLCSSCSMLGTTVGR